MERECHAGVMAHGSYAFVYNTTIYIIGKRVIIGALPDGMDTFVRVLVIIICAPTKTTNHVVTHDR